MGSISLAVPILQTEVGNIAETLPPPLLRRHHSNLKSSPKRSRTQCRSGTPPRGLVGAVVVAMHLVRKTVRRVCRLPSVFLAGRRRGLGGERSRVFGARCRNGRFVAPSGVLASVYAVGRGRYDQRSCPPTPRADVPVLCPPLFA